MNEPIINNQNDLLKILALANLPLRVIDPNRRYWFLRTESGKYYEDFLFNSYIAIGWNEISILNEESSDSKVSELIKQYYPESITGRVLNPIKRFCMEMKVGDLVVIPSTSSATFAFGIIESNAFIYTDEIPEFDGDGAEPCPYTKRREVRWLSSLDRHRVDPHLFQFFRAHQAISDASANAEHIDRTLNTFYMKNDQAHIVLDVCTEDNIPANKLIKFMGGLLECLDEVAVEQNASDKITVKVSVQSPGIIEFIGDAYNVSLITIVLIMIVGGKASFSKNGPTIQGAIETPGLIEKAIQVYERVFADKTKESKLLESIQELKIKDPTDGPRA